MSSLRVIILFLPLILGCYSLYTFQRNHFWKNNFTLWTNCVEKSPQKARPHNNLGNACRDKKLYDQAITHYRQALKIWPTYSLAHNNLGVAYGLKKLYSQAIEEIGLAIKLNPSFSRAY
ncbi:MAG: tetratricopeptide repeat protein, partial [Thermodesulfobacteriota bacterium]